MKDPDNQPDSEHALDGLLRESLTHESRVREDFVGGVMSQIDGEIEAEQDHIIHLNWQRTGLAAAASLVVGLFLFLSSSPPKATAVASVRDVRGQAFLIRAGNGERLPIANGMDLFVGDQIVCGNDGSVISDHLDGTVVDLIDGKLIVGGSENSRNAIELESGRALCSLATGRRGTIAFATPHAEGEGTDSTVELVVNEEQTRVRALAGDVRVWNRGRDTAWAPVTEGSSAPLRAKTFDPENIGPGDTVWAQEFDADFKSGASIEGILVTERENQRLTTLIQSLFIDPKFHEDSFKPNEWISLELYSKRTLFVLPADMEMVIRVRAQEKGIVRMAMSAADPKIKAEHVITDPIPVGAEWQRLVIPAEAFLAFGESRPAEKGLPVRAVTLWGFQTGTVDLDRIILRRRK